MEENNFQDLSFLKPEISVSAGETIQKDIQSKYKPTQSTNIGASVPSLDQIINSKVDSRMSAYDSAPLLDIYKPLSSGEYVSMYESYMPGIDNQQRLAERQSTGEKWANGINKFIGKTTNAVVGGTVGILYGAGAALSDGNFSSVYDNKFSNWLNDLDTKMNYKLPNYYNRQEQEKGLFGQMGTANFWADKFLGGLSFTAGALISEGIWAYATGGTSLATSGARWANRLGRASKWGIEATEDIAKVTSATSKYKALLNSVPGQLYKTGVISKDTAIMAGKAGELASVGLFMGRSAGYEASVEALQYKKEAEEKFFSNFAELNGREPNADDIAEFNKNLEKSANAVFGVNMAIVGSSNLVTMGHILDIKNPIKMGVSDFIDRKAFGYGVEKLANGTFKVLDPTRAQKITRGLFNYVVKPGVTEGLFEEGGQGVTTKTANKWIEHTYNPKHANDNFDSIGAFYESVAEQYGTKEGWVENGLGILIGIVGGSINASSEGKAKEQELEMKASVANTFNDKTLQSILLPYKLQTANRISGFSEEAKEEAEKGNVTKSVLAQKSAVLSYVNAKLTLGDSIKDISKEMQKSLDLVTEEQWESMGIDVDNIEEHKSELISEYTNLAKQWKTNKTYWQYMIGRKFVGEKDLETTALEDVLGTPFNKNAAVVEALAWQSTIGENANLLMKDSLDKIGTELGQEQADVLNLITLLKTQSKETRQEVSSSVLKYNALKQERDRLEKGIAELNVSISATEGDKSKATKMAEKTNRLLELDTELNSLRDKIENITQDMLKADSYSKGLDELDFSQEIGLSIVSADSLLSINENIKKFESLLSSLESTNPQRLQYLNDLLDEYNQAEDVFLKSNASQKAILSKDFKIENIGSWLGGKLKRSKGMNENTQEWFQTALNDYANNKVKGANYGKELEQETEEQQPSVEETAQENNQETKPKTEEVKQEEPKTQLEIYKERIENLLRNSYNNLTYIGENYDGIANKKPNQAEIEEFKSVDKNSPRYQELKKKLSDWKLLDAAVDEEYVSIAEMVELINQLEQEVEVQDTKDEVTPQDIEEIKEEIEGTNITTDYTLLQNTQGTATVVKPANSDVYRLSHVKMATIVQSLNKPFTVKRKGKEIKPDLDKLQPNDVVIVDDMSLLYLPGGVIEIKIDDFRARQQALNMYIYDSGVKWTYKNIYTVKGNDFVKMPSDFSEDINSQEIYNQSKGDKLFLVVDDTDGFNETDFGGTKEQLKIFVTDSKGNKLSTLKALKQGTVNEDFLMLREEAFKRWEQAGKPSKMNLGIELEVDAVFLGSPQVTMSESFAPANIPITEKGAKNITATGYIEDGEVILNREIPEVNKSMVSKISKNNPGKKIPVVVIKKGVYNIVYPITMVKTPTPQLDLFDGIINSTIPNQEKVIRINNEIQKQGIQVEKLTYEDILDEVKVNRVREAFANKQTFVSADALSKREYKMSNLTKDVVINLDLEDLDNAISDAKIRVSFNNIVYKTERDLKNDNLIEVEDQLNDLALELYRDYTRNASTKYLNSKGEIIEDIPYTDAFSDNEVTVAENNLQKLHNISVLRQAFSQKVPKSIENIIGAQKVREVKKLLDQYQFIKDQIAVKDSELKDGKKNADCK